jgi:hypothetical protein
MSTALRTSSVVFQLPNKGSWFENTAITSDGTILATLLDVPEVLAIDPDSKTGSTLLKFPAPITSVTGITEISPDVFALGVGQYDLAKGPVQGSWEIWTFSLAGGVSEAQSSLRLICKTPDASLVNGITTWNSNSILAVDSTFGVVYKIDINTGSCTVAFSDELTKPPADAPLPIGINGIKVRDGYVYFTNSARQTFYRVQVDKETAVPTGEFEVVASGFTADDFTFDTEGSAYIVTHPINTVIKIVPGSAEVVTIAGKSDSMEIAGGTACAFGRRSNDFKTLYVVTAGGLAMPVNGETEPAKVVAINLE